MIDYIRFLGFGCLELGAQNTLLGVVDRSFMKGVSVRSTKATTITSRRTISPPPIPPYVTRT